MHPDDAPNGQVDAPRRWFLKAVADLKLTGLIQHPLDPCVFLSYDDNGQLDGFLLVYVDDFLGAGDLSSNYGKRIAHVKRLFKLRQTLLALSLPV